MQSSRREPCPGCGVCSWTRSRFRLSRRFRSRAPALDDIAAFAHEKAPVPRFA